jgi:hypothetical protein
MAIVARSRPVAAGGWAGELSLQPTPRTEAVGRGGVPEGRWPSATGPPGAAELHPLGGPTNSESRESMEGSMATVAQMTKDELREMIETIIEQKLLELVGDPDEGLPLRKTIRNRLLRQKEAVARGERGEPFEEVVQRLGLE